MNKQQLANKIWESANKMRSKIEANEYKDYILGFIFYKYLSDQEVKFLKDNDFAEEDIMSLKENLTEDEITSLKADGCTDDEIRKIIEEEFNENFMNEILNSTKLY